MSRAATPYWRHCVAPCGRAGKRSPAALRRLARTRHSLRGAPCAQPLPGPLNMSISPGKSTSDMSALQAGLPTPPHVSVLAQVHAIRYPFNACEGLSKLGRRIASHIENVEKHKIKSERIGTNVFIGHGQSSVWKDLKDFIQDRITLPWDEFKRVPVAGVTNIDRLSQMSDEASIAFLIMTAEDEQVDGKQHARQNVIHEAALFQGRLGFQRAIILLEEGCEEFSNVQGLARISHQFACCHLEGKWTPPGPSPTNSVLLWPDALKYFWQRAKNIIDGAI